MYGPCKKINESIPDRERRKSRGCTCESTTGPVGSKTCVSRGVHCTRNLCILQGKQPTCLNGLVLDLPQHNGVLVDLGVHAKLHTKAVSQLIVPKGETVKVYCLATDHGALESEYGPLCASRDESLPGGNGAARNVSAHKGVFQVRDQISLRDRGLMDAANRKVYGGHGPDVDA